LTTQTHHRQVVQEGCKRVEGQKPGGSEEPDEGGRARKVSIMVNKKYFYGIIIVTE
jgi:hypothetical protein